GWGIGLDLGATYFVGDWGFFKDVRLGLSLLDIGKGYSTAGLTGVFGTAATSYPSAFTLGLGMRGYLIQSYNWNLDAGLDLWSPSFQDLGADLSLGFGFRDYVSIRLGWSVGLRDTIEGTGRSYLPSLGLSGTIPLGKGFSIGGRSHKDASVSASTAIAPLYDGLYAMAAGFNLSFGLKDKTPPVIEATLPVAFHGIAYISPNGDGEQDSLDIPVKITDMRYVAGWQMKVEDKSSGKVVKTIGESNDRVDSIGSIADLRKALAFEKKSVAVPDSIRWDGKDDNGTIVPDGPYTVSIVAWDDNGNYNLDYQSCMTVVVDGKLPQASVKPLEPSMILSPDGDGSKDTLAFRNTGSVESGWKVEIADAAGTIVRTEEYKERSAPHDFAWDGTANDGKRVPDGSYSLKLSAKDEAGNKVVGEISNIVVDTSRPAVSVATDESVMSPNGDGVRDSLQIISSVESFKGLESWKVFVLDPARKEVWTVAGGPDTSPEKSYTFSGLSLKGETLADGQYEAGIELRYMNGYSPQKLSAPFYMDRTPPSATVGLADPNHIFSPDGDGS
ncbi:MAG TPA: FlgD immunoglobulin-like domain containing protein, partial [Rectinemataceae bacterium]|nr:FlgD immunoglobulin-like domain containing protein [Rectinemataceae bacterium]